MIREILKTSANETKQVLMKPKALGTLAGLFALSSISSLVIQKNIYLSIAFIVGSFILSIYITLFVARTIETDEKKLIDDETVSFKARLIRATKVSILAMLIPIGIVAIVAIVCAMIATAQVFKGIEIAFSLLVIAIFPILCAYLFRIFLIIPISVLSDMEKPFQTSLRMTKGNAWKIFFINFVPMIILMINSLISLAFLKSGMGQVLNYIITFPLGLIGTVFYTIIPINVYYYLRNTNNEETQVYEAV